MKIRFIKQFHALPVLFAAAFVLSGCASDGDEAPLAGERISVLQLQRELAPEASAAQIPMSLPETWTNQSWPQAGGYPNHMMGHLSLNASLKQVWKTSIGAGGTRRTPLLSSPVVGEGKVFTLDTNGEISAFDLSTGDRKWRQSLVPRGEEDSGAIGGGLAYVSGKIYATNGYKHLVAIDSVTGALVWKTATASPLRSAPTVLEDRVFAITLDNKLMAFSAADGSLLWTYNGVAETTNLLGSASPAADATSVILPLSSGEIFGLRPENGQIAWEDNLSAVRHTGALSSIADIRGLPVIDQGVVYAASYSGRMVAIDQITGRRLWQREIGSAEMPWVSGDAVFIISEEQQLTALTRAGGEIRWVTALPRHDDDDKSDPVVWTGPVLAGGRLIAASSGGQMVEVDPASGKILRTENLPGSVTLPPLVVDNTLIFITADGQLAAYR